MWFVLRHLKHPLFFRTSEILSVGSVLWKLGHIIRDVDPESRWFGIRYVFWRVFTLNFAKFACNYTGVGRITLFGTISFLITFSFHWIGPLGWFSRNILLSSVVWATFCIKKNGLLLPFTNVESQIGQLQKDSLREKIRKDIGLRFSKFWLRNAENNYLLGFHHSLLMGILLIMPLVPGYPCSVPGYPWSVPGYPWSVPACP